jgi:hypothetical protein
MASQHVPTKGGQNSTLTRKGCENCLQGCILFDFLPEGKTIRMNHEVQTLKKLQYAFNDEADKEAMHSWLQETAICI